MNKTIYSLLLLLMGPTVFAQSTIEDVLDRIAQNNSTLKALQQQIEAEKLNNKSGIYLSNPEVEFEYLFNTPKGPGSENNLNISQQFDFATISGRRSKLAEQQNVRADLQYKGSRINILSEAKQYLIDYVHFKNLKQQLQLRLDHARTIANVYKKRLDQGDANILEFNKAQLNLAMVEGEISATEVERTALKAQLTRLNGGEELSLEQVNFDFSKLPEDFESWFQSAQDKNSALALAQQDIVVNKQQVQVNKAMGLPNFSAGYVREQSPGMALSGFTVGLSIPLWENKNRVRAAQTAIRAAEENQADIRLQFYNQLHTYYDRAIGLQRTANAYRQSLASNNSIELLRKALDAGQLSLLEYMVELSIYYENVNRTLQAEREYQQAVALLREVEL